MILECYALASGEVPLERVRDVGVLVGSVSINSSAAEVLLGPLVNGPLSGLDLGAAGTTCVMFPAAELASLNLMLASSGVDPDMTNAISDAADEAIAQGAALWICMA